MANKQDGTVEKVKENVVDVLKGFARYAHASYCEEKLLNWTCDPCVEGFTEQASFVKVFLNKTTEGRAYMAVDYLRKSVVIGFRGTVSAQNWYYDLKTDFVNATEALEWPLAAKDTGRIHRGFTETYLSIKHQIMPLLLRVRAALPSFNIITVGHSMGAALAALAAVDFHYTLISPPKILSFTYGQPRIGDLEFSNSVNKLHDSQDVMIYRMINNNDLIPHVFFIYLVTTYSI